MNTELRFRADIEGLRAVAVTTVVLFHSGVPAFTGGFVGVDIFFVVSGFLITSLLVTEWHRTGRVRIARFYARRVRRLLPAATLVLLGSLLAGLRTLPFLVHGDLSQDVRSAALFASNVRFAALQTDYFERDGASLVQHFWSLSIEEQFYAVFPALLVVLLLAQRRWRRPALPAVALLVITLASFAIGRHLTAVNSETAFFFLPCRAWELGTGAVLALATSHLLKLGHRTRQLLATIGLLGIGWSVLAFNEATPFPGTAALLPVLSIAALIAAGTTDNGIVAWPTRLLSRRPFEELGKLSYAIYLLHWPALLLLYDAAGERFPFGRDGRWIAGTALMALFVLPAAWLSGRVVEGPIRRSARLTQVPRLTIVGGAALVALVVAASFAPTGSARLDAGRVAAKLGTGTPPPLQPTNFVPRNMRPTLAEAYKRDDMPRHYHEKCNVENGRSSPDGTCNRYGDPHGRELIVLFGDSHAGQWFSPIDEYARQSGRRLAVMTKSGCPAVPLPAISRANRPSCEQWRENSFASIDQMRPALVVVSDFLSRHYAENPEPLEDALDAALTRLRRVAAVVVFGENPFMAKNFPACASESLRDVRPCEPKLSASLATLVSVETKISRRHRAGFVDLRDWLCASGRCPGIVGDVLVYRDAHHITETFARLQDDAVARVLERAL